jgi:ureidoglycolate dehydrogenase (NAD+)
MAEETVTFSADALRDYAARLLEAGGFQRSDAKASAELLVWANLRGTDSHGVLRIPRYVEMVEQGEIDPAAEPRIMHEHGATALVDAGLAPGATGMMMVTDRAVEIAGRHGIGLCAARRVTHAGAIGFFAHRVAAAGMVGIVMTASKPLMAYVGARGEAISSNPLAIAAPSLDDDEPIVLDMSTAAVALGKIMAARDAGREIPLGWAIDADGNETTNPTKVTALLPMASAKGAGLSLMIEILASILSGNPIIAPALEGEKPEGFNGLVIAINPAAIGDPAVFLAEVQRLATAIHALPPTSGVDTVLLPGERGRLSAASLARDGIAVAGGTVKNLDRLAAKLGIAQSRQ